LITPEIHEGMVWRSRIDAILVFHNLFALYLKHDGHRIVNKTFTVPKIGAPADARGEIEHFLMDNKMGVAPP